MQITVTRAEVSAHACTMSAWDARFGESITLTWDEETQLLLLGCADIRPQIWWLVSKRIIPQIQLAGADLTGADLTGADLTGADISGANLTGAYLSGADLSGANLTGAYLSGADLSGADLSDADLSGADLWNADLSDANLTGADLTGADISGANLSDADLSGADLSGADLTGAIRDATTPHRHATTRRHPPMTTTMKPIRIFKVIDLTLPKPELGTRGHAHEQSLRAYAEAANHLLWLHDQAEQDPECATRDHVPDAIHKAWCYLISRLRLDIAEQPVLHVQYRIEFAT